MRVGRWMLVALDADTVANPTEDDQVEPYNRIYRNLINEMAISFLHRSRSITSYGCHNLERMVDRVTNICERIVYVATGQ
jgi:phosphate transport system protein